ncbi:MAG TPA: discoidin domain-containing protein [Roseiflexaceae bacterium]|nr:discoidin domain-containing protein [Roseiflexaceae bacterium]
MSEPRTSLLSRPGSAWRKRLALILIAALFLPSFGFVALPSRAAPGNLALNRPVAVSSSEDAVVYPAAAAVDGSSTTRWASAFSDPQWIQIDLGSSQAIGRVVLSWEGAYGRAYQIQTSATGSTWTTIYSTTTGDGGVDDFAASGTGRYIRLYGTGRGTGYGYSLWEFEVYAPGGPTATPTRTSTPIATVPPGCGTTNVARGKTATASSALTGGAPALAVDGDAGTRWESAYSDPQWLQIDLGASASICRVRLSWEGAYASAYQIQTSPNGSTWTTVATTTGGDGGVDDLFVSGSGRYIRVYGTARGTGYGYSLWEVEVYTPGTSATPTTTATPTRTGTPTATVPSGTVQVPIRIPYVEYLEIGLSPADQGNTSLVKTQNAAQTATVSYPSGTALTLRVNYMVSGAGQSAIFSAVDQSGATRTGNPLTITVYPGLAVDVVLVNNTPTPTPNLGVNLALNKPATASSSQAGLPPGAAVDGDAGTRWGSEWSDPQWLQVDLGSVQPIRRVLLRWEGAYARSYQIQTSNDATTWSTIGSTTTGDGGTDELSVNGSGRYIRVYGTVRGSAYGYSLWEFEVYSSAGAPTATPLPTAPPTATPTATPAPAFGLLAPAGGSMIINTRRPTLSWQALAGTARYEVWMNITRSDYDFTAPGSLLERYSKLAEVTGTSYTLASDLPDRWTYKWYVVAIDGAGQARRSNTLDFGLYLPALENVSDGIGIVNGARDLNKDGAIQPYEDWRLPVETRVNDLLSRMSVQEKAYQMFYNAQVYPLSGWHFGPAQPRDLYNAQLATAGTRLGIPLVSTGDTIHGYQTSFPVQSALAASRNFNMAYRVADMQRREQLPVGYRGTLGPLAEVDTKVLYPRFQEGNGENAEIAAAMMRAMIAGFQAGPELNPASVLVTTKHWPGEGAGGEAGITFDGISINYHMIPWRAAFEAGSGGVMPGYAGSSFLDPGGPGAGDSKPIIDYLRINMGYDGLVTTDWLPSGNWVRAANAGSDVMGGADPGVAGFDMNTFINGVPQSRIDQAVRRILRVKFKLGIFENPYGDPVGGPSAFHTPANVELVTQAAREAMTLLKNTGVLPLRLAPGDNLIVAGPRATDGASCCIWTSYFHTDYGSQTMFQAIQQRAQQAGVNVYQDSAPNPKAAVVIVGEASYTHGTNWNKDQPYLPPEQLSIVQNLKTQNIPVVVVYVMPRPYVITWESQNVDAIVVAYRSGEGGAPALAQLLFGDYEPSGRLPFQLPRDMSQVGTDVESNQLERWDLPYDLGATEAQRQDIRNKIAAGQPVPTTYGNPLYPFGAGIQGFGLTDSSPPAAFGLTAPASGATVQNTLPTFSWQASSDAQTGIKLYQVWLDGQKVAEVKTNQYTLAGRRLASGTHSWSVVAVNWAGGETRSPTSSFTFQDTAAPNVFDLVAPAAGATLTGGTQELAWEASFDPGAGLDRYELWLDGANVASIPSAGSPPVASNLAQNKPVTTSSAQTGVFAPAMAVDGNPTTRWESAYGDPQWFQIDLGQPMAITRVVLRWEAAYGSAYRVQVSNDGSTWSDIFSTAAGDGGVDDLAGLRGYGRYVRMYGTARATAYGYSLWEFEVYGAPVQIASRTGLAAGTHSWYVVAVDAFGNRRQSTSTRSFTIR